MPAEWEPHLGTWFSWPHNRDTWPTGLESAERALALGIQLLAEGERVYVNVLSDDHARHVRNLTGSHDNLEFVTLPTNDAWCRDHGATWVYDASGHRLAISWNYNAWGGKYPPFDLDRKVAARMAAHVGDPVEHAGITFEGGAIETNGAGVILTTASCLLNPNRNPGLYAARAEALLERVLGARHIVWLGGELEGDDTDGHIDNLARFTNETTIVYPMAANDLPHRDGFLENRDILSRCLPSHFLLREAPHPDPVHHAGVRLPASYMNFYIGNGHVLMPAYGGEKDEIMQELLAELFPDREIAPIPCVEIIRGLGAVHCLSQQIPR
ncbi:MAG: agmatine deiminase [Bacteroidetes bacterium CG12_big_fil_rev_8_21_14_0_65_60_17]|nr:MAG: agmatine deiminase [Bacteroidetes bacterium CG12_big_fil_rev_8_21_14_0_65_60_17]